MSASSQPPQASFACQHCHQPIFIPAGLPPTKAPCPHCGKEVTSPDFNQAPSPSPEVPDQRPSAASLGQATPVAPVAQEAGPNDLDDGGEQGTDESQGKRKRKRKGKSKSKEQPDILDSWSPTRGGNRRRGRTGKYLLATVVLMLFAVGFGAFWLVNKGKSKPSSVASSGNQTTGSALVTRAAPKRSVWKDKASQVLYGFMTAKSPDERMQYVIPNEGVREELEMFYPAGTDDSDTPKESFAHSTGSESDHERGIFLMQYRQPAQIDMRDYFAPIGSLDKILGMADSTLIEMAHQINEDNLSKPIGVNAFFKKTDEGLKLDASVFIQGKFRTFRAFVDYPRPGKTQVFRVVASEGIDHHLLDDKRYRTYRLDDFAYPKDHVKVAVLVDSEVGKILSPLNWRGMNRDMMHRTATVELGWSNAKPSKLQIERVLCWEFLGVGGELGNTRAKLVRPTLVRPESTPQAPAAPAATTPTAQGQSSLMEATIAAIATPPGMGAVAMIRVSGPEAFVRVSQCLPAGQDAASFPERYAKLTTIVDLAGEPVDEVLLTCFHGPKSYTGEDTVEIACHGGVLVTRQVLQRMLDAGVEPAGAGEFSQRAFMNGKMDLTQAEAVMDLISAQTELAMRAAHEQLQGTLGKDSEAIRDELLGMAAHVEAYIDFPEEDIDADTGAALLKRLRSVAVSIARLLQTAEQGRILREGVRTVIFGSPNAGKSSLLNRLLGYERAIVSDIEGTTRDTVEEVINLEGIPVRLIDTAGMRESEDSLEQQGVKRTRDQLETADLILEVVDGTRPVVTHLDQEQIGGRHHILVVNKCDLAENIGWSGAEGVRLSCITGEGLHDLTDVIAKELSMGAGEWGGHAVAINARHQACLKRAKVALQTAEKTLTAGAGAEFISIELRDAMDAIGEIAGRIDTEELLGEIFSSFCIGK